MDDFYDTYEPYENDLETLMYNESFEHAVAERESMRAEQEAEVEAEVREQLAAIVHKGVEAYGFTPGYNDALVEAIVDALREADVEPPAVPEWND